MGITRKPKRRALRGLARLIMVASLFTLQMAPTGTIAYAEADPKSGSGDCAYVTLTAFTAQGVPVRSQVCLVDLGTGEVLDGPVTLPGRALLSEKAAGNVAGGGSPPKVNGWWMLCTGPDHNALYPEPRAPLPVWSALSLDPAATGLAVNSMGVSGETPPIFLPVANGSEGAFPLLRPKQGAREPSRWPLEMMTGIEQNPEFEGRAQGIIANLWELDSLPEVAAVLPHEGGYRVCLLNSDHDRGLSLLIPGDGANPSTKISWEIPEDYERDSASQEILRVLRGL